MMGICEHNPCPVICRQKLILRQCVPMAAISQKRT
jgi:hypothetical protein